MNNFTIVVLSISSLTLFFGIYQMFWKKKWYWIPIEILIALGIVMLVLGQTTEVTGGSFADVMYTVFGVFLLFLALIVGLIISWIQSRKNKESD